MKDRKNNKGFTLAELLIVIAIVAALVAIMIPTFSGQLERAREAADIANVRATCSEVACAFAEGKDTSEQKIPATQKQEKWLSANGADYRDEYVIAGEKISVPYKIAGAAGDAGYYTVWCDADGVVQVK